MIRREHDIEQWMQQRMEVIDCVFGHPEAEAMRALQLANRQYAEQHLADGSLVACTMAYGEEWVACGAYCCQSELPSPDNPSGSCAYLMNIYVKPIFRSLGYGAEIVEWLVSHAKAQGIDKIYLESSNMAESLYERLRFTFMKNMMRYEDD